VADGVEVNPSQSTVALGGRAPTHFTVTYTIRSTATLKGFYFLDVQGLNPTGCAAEFRFAVGYVFTGTNGSGFYFSSPSGAEQCISAGVGFIPRPPLRIRRCIRSRGWVWSTWAAGSYPAT